MKIPLAIVGCGGMGGRHLLGLQELSITGLDNVYLQALCDLRRENAEYLADETEKLLGYRPLVFDNMAQMVNTVSDLQAVVITTDARAHHLIACQAFDLGLHVLCEKPLALTVKGCNRILKAQKRVGKILSVAENYRRDPMSRLTKALLEQECIGQPQLYMDISASSGNRIIITSWRHMKLSGGMLLDGGVHNADMALYYMGDVKQIYAKIALWEKTRVHPEGSGGVSGFYEHWAKEMPSSIQATAEDTLVSVIDFKSGAMGQWTQNYAAHGRGFGHKVIYGSRGSLNPGGTRNGQPPVITFDTQEKISGSELLNLVPDFHLDYATSHLFGSERPAGYNIPFPSADRKLLAIEIHEFGSCIIDNTQPEVDGRVGRRAAAYCYAAFESSQLNRPVTLDEIEAEIAGSYEAEINAVLKI